MASPFLPSNNIDELINEFFLEPDTLKIPPGFFSNLFLLRRDAIRCIGGKLNQSEYEQLPTHFRSDKPRALWAGLITIFSGIDLLAKMNRGNGEYVGDRFRAYCEEFVVSDKPTLAAPLYKLRCALVHSFTLYDDQERIRYVLTEDLPQEVDLNKAGFVHFDVKKLFDRFEESIPRIKNWIAQNKDSIPDLMDRFEKYGFTYIEKRDFHIGVSTLSGSASGGPF
jgi:hypothetical protein